jgi:uncharacterized protein (DUF1330 family)
MARISLVVSLWLKDEDITGFEEFESAAADIMSRYGGRIEKVIRCGIAERAPFEVLIVTFPTEEAVRQYRQDPRFAALLTIRERVIARTEVWRGREMRPYGAHGGSR